MEQQDSTSISKPHGESDRYIHDMQQAMAMRRRSNPKPSPTTPASSPRNSTTSKQEAVSLGLRGLDEADLLREEGHAQCALELYQSAIEVLIRSLQDPAISTYDKEALQERIRVALSDAEYIKERIKRGDVKQGQTTCESSTESPMKRTCFSRITEYLAKIRVGNAQPSKGKKQPQPAPSYRPIGGQQATSPRKSAAPRQQTSLRNTNVASRPVNTVARNSRPARQQQPQQGGALANLAAKESQLIRQTVMNDMYVPQAKLQYTTWDDIAGLAPAKQALQEAAIMPLIRPDLFTGLRKPQNILLYGPPGTGKTMLVKAVAYESKCSLFVCSASSVTSKWHGEGEKLVRALFEAAKQCSPSIVFIDEIDSLLSTRKSDGEHEASRRFKTEFMVNMDGISPTNDKNRVLLIACTNCPWDVDSAILRRFSRRIFVPLPDKDARKALVKSLLKKAGKHSLDKSDISDIVKRLKGFSGSDIQAIASEASFGPLRSVGSLDEIRSVRENDVRPIAIEDFDDAIEQATKSVSKGQLKKYDEWKTEQGA
ncbi:Fidgetin-like protein 1 [Seminavis robusta]|uniref:Fidgetin-like protein 1 n=1 Tax=Seminavis robusta TaxID=568900 RepID=A0A9N8E1U0_9STRA|nr:Fidgetin-like protein 1 [Seminavis robusta]|eukprot:Sro566_g167770.1 Fidgetin-like protein 1 (541) ;mRNA; f:13175-14989